MTRRLSLRKETLVELTASDLSSVVGGVVTTNCFTGIWTTIITRLTGE